MLSRDQICSWLCEDKDEALSDLWHRADSTRNANVGSEIRLRGLIEISNVCCRTCSYCGLAAYNTRVQRYRLSDEQIIDAARTAKRLGCGTAVLQSGEDPHVSDERIAEIVRRIKGELDLAVTLSLGERNETTLSMWRKAGADRYLLRFETSDKELFARIHPAPAERNMDRIGMLGNLRRLGYEVGSGVMVGIPGQTYESLANDIALFRSFDLDMIGAGPFIPHPHTPLGTVRTRLQPDHVPASDRMAYKVVALARIVRPDANIPSTTAITALDFTDGRKRALSRGANVVMLNCTPQEHRAKYTIYPDKARLVTPVEEEAAQLERIADELGLTIGSGPGGRRPVKNGSIPIECPTPCC